MSDIPVDPRVASAAGVIGSAMVADIVRDGWCPPMIGALSDDCRQVDATILERQDPGTTLEDFFRVAKETLQEGIGGGSSTVFACVALRIEGTIGKEKEETNRMAAAVLWADRRGWYGTIFVPMPDGTVGSLGLGALCKGTQKHLFEVFFVDLIWPTVN